MADEVHYETFRQQQPKGSWVLEGVNAKRDDAIKLAEALVARRRAAGARVVKQAYDPKTSDFLSLTIFETGARSLALDPKAEDAPTARVCQAPEDFYTPEARSVVARLLSDYLARQRLTAGELMHRADALKQFEATDAAFQHAVQRIAVVQSAGSDTPVQDIIKRLNALVIAAMHQVYRDAEQGRFVEAGIDNIGELATSFAGAEDGSYLFNAALARYLKPAGSWDGKLSRLTAALDKAPASGDGRTLLCECVDAMIEEVVGSPAALAELLGGRDNMNAALQVLIELFLGHAAAGAQPGVAALAAHFAKGALPRARRAVAQRILAELKSTRRLVPTSVLDEIKALRRIAARLMGGVGPFLDPEDLAAAFTLRGRRVVTRQALDQALDGAANPDEKLERLFFVLHNVIGAENKRALAAYLTPFLSGGSFEGHYLAAHPSPATVLKRLAEHQARVMRAGFSAEQCDDIASLFDRLAVQVENRSGYFKSAEAKSRDTVEKALFYLNLCRGAVTQGRLAQRARKAALGHMKQPDFQASFAARLKRANPDADAKTELARLLDGTGIEPAEAFGTAA